MPEAVQPSNDLNSIMPFFSIVIPTFNRAALVERAVKSVLAQSFNDFEVIVVDDGSTDDTKNTLQKFSSDSRFKYIFQENQKESAARNNGVSVASGDYVCFLDSDDVYYPNHLEVLKQAIEENQHAPAFYHTFSDIINERGEVRKKQERYVEAENAIYKVYVNKALPDNVCLPKSIAKNYRFREDIYNDEDAELFYRIAADFPVISIPVYTVLYYEHGGNTVNHLPSANHYYNRILSLRAYLNNPTVKGAFPEGFFEKRLSRNLHWYAEALLREGRPSEARKAMFESAALQQKSRWNKETIVFTLKSMLKR